MRPAQPSFRSQRLQLVGQYVPHLRVCIAWRDLPADGSGLEHEVDDRRAFARRRTVIDPDERNHLNLETGLFERLSRSRLANPLSNVDLPGGQIESMTCGQSRDLAERELGVLSAQRC